MLLASARSLKEEVLHRIIDPYAAAASGFLSQPRGSTDLEAAFRKLQSQPLAVSASANRGVPHRSVGIGISKHGAEFRLALRVQRQSLMRGPLVERLSQAARGEVDIRLVGPIEKRAGLAGRARSPTGKGGIRALSLAPWYQTNCRPLRIGASIAHQSVTAGTLGAFVSRDGKNFVLSNNHVLANENQAQVGDAVLQRAPFDGGTVASDRIGGLATWVPLAVNGSNTVDAAIAEIESVEWDPSSLNGLPAGGVGRLLGSAEGDGSPETVYKIGRTTGMTQGRVSAFEVGNVVVGYDIGGLRFDGVTEIDSVGSGHFSDGGDSGALVVNQAMEAVALLFAGSDTGVSYASPLGTVLDTLGVQLLT